MQNDKAIDIKWYRVGDHEMLDIDRITTVQAGHKSICLTRTEKGYGAICNRCPHQGGPLGDGMLENGYVVCPWHAWEYDPITGNPPGGYEDAVDSFPVELREDGIYVGVQEELHISTLMDQMVELMIDWGVNTVFGMVGHSNLGLAEAFYKFEQKGKLRYFGIRHEGAAAFAASAYGKLTNTPAVCFGIAGPGATNLLTGLWDAKVDRAPVLAFTGQVNTQVLGPGAAIKHSIIRRDVAHLIFPDEVQTLPAFENPSASQKEQRISRMNIEAANENIVQAAEMINQAEKPCIIVGNGGRRFKDEIIQFAEKIDAPIITTFKAKGTIPDIHPLACGVLGRSGTRVASATMVRSDLLIVLGASFSNHTGISNKRKTIQIDIDRMMLGKFHDVDLPIWGDIKTTLSILQSRVDEKTIPERRKYIARLWDRWRKEKERRANTYDETQRIPNARIFQELSDLLPDDSIVTVDVGNNAYSFGMYFEAKNQDVLMSGYLGSIGFAFPAALGAWAAEGDQRKIIAIAGDGGFGQYMAEFTTAVKYKMAITLILLNNDELGKISREQRAGNFHVWQTSLTNPNFAKYAKNCGGLGIRVDKVEDLNKAIKQALEYKTGPSLVEIISTSGQL
jgi:thiamine pyrophosphate-dependent acetolactate synthase large subunit-like protein/nitrite reductase/ring-hydroxylating ferredoxin subunit